MIGARKSFSGHVLLAEDDPMSRLATQEMLTMLGCRITAVPDGLKALAQYEASEFDLIILDISMPGLDGFGTTRRIRNSQKSGAKSIPIIAMTGHDEPQQKSAHRDAGTNGVLVKPATLLALRKVLERWLPSSCKREGAPEGDSSLPSAQEAETLYLPPLLEFAALQGPGESDIVQEMAKIFLAETPPRLSALSEALAQRNFHRLEETAHTIKGSCGVISALHMVSLCEAIEESTKEKKISAIERYVRLIHEEYIQVKNQLAAKPWKNQTA